MASSCVEPSGIWWIISVLAVLNFIPIFTPTPFVVDADTTRCYDNLGCYDSGIFHALPQEPSFVRTSFTGSCRGHIDDVTIQAVDNETYWRMLIDNSSLDTSLETVFIVHGFTDSASASWVGRMRDAFLQQGDFNVFALDWSHAAQFPYEQAVANSYLVAKQLANFLEYLERVHGLSPSRVHLVGHSLGAQISGNAGNDLKTSHVARISGLDPAEPYFGYQNDSMRLDASDALFVDVIHTDGERFSGFHGYGSLRAQGHVDFYPNGGTKQPGCNDPNSPFGILTEKPLQRAIACSHARAIDLFISSLERPDGGCNFPSYPCSSWQEYERGRCSACPKDYGCPVMGFRASKALNGTFYLSTSAEEPYCGTSYVIEVKASQGQGHSYGRLMLTLNGTGGMTNTTELNRANHHFHKNESDHHVITVTSDVGDITSALLEFIKGNGLSSIGTSHDLELAAVSISRLRDNKSWTFSNGANSPSTNSTTVSMAPLVLLRDGVPSWVTIIP